MLNQDITLMKYHYLLIIYSYYTRINFAIYKFVLLFMYNITPIKFYC